MKIIFVSLIVLFSRSGYIEVGKFNTMEECKAARELMPDGLSHCIINFEGTYK